MEVDGHQAVGADFGASSASELRHEFDLIGVVGVAKEGALPSIAALSNVMGKTGDHHSRHPGHGSAPWLVLSRTVSPRGDLSNRSPDLRARAYGHR